jgi:excisionase family DNA binding protein
MNGPNGDEMAAAKSPSPCPLPQGGEAPDAMLTKRELAWRLKISVRTLENWQRRGVLPFVKVGKIVLYHWPDVVAHLKNNFQVCRRTYVS